MRSFLSAVAAWIVVTFVLSALATGSLALIVIIVKFVWMHV